MASAGWCCSSPGFLDWIVLTKTRPCWCAGLIDTLYERLLLPHKWRSVSAKAMLRQQRSQLDCHRDNECPFAWFQMVETPGPAIKHQEVNRTNADKKDQPHRKEAGAEGRQPSE